MKNLLTRILLGEPQNHLNLLVALQFILPLLQVDLQSLAIAKNLQPPFKKKKRVGLKELKFEKCKKRRKQKLLRNSQVTQMNLENQGYAA